MPEIIAAWRTTPILNYEESLLIFNHVASSIRFLQSLELPPTATIRRSWHENEWWFSVIDVMGERMI